MNAPLLWTYQQEGKVYEQRQEERGPPVRTASMCQSGDVQ
jgi:hypothetical protein